MLFQVGELTLCFHDVVFLLSPACFCTTFPANVVEVMASGRTHVLEMCLGASKGMIPVKYFC